MELYFQIPSLGYNERPTHPKFKKLACDASEKVSKWHNWVTFFWLVENYNYFSYPKCGKVMTRSEMSKFEDEYEKRI